LSRARILTGVAVAVVAALGYAMDQKPQPAPEPGAGPRALPRAALTTPAPVIPKPSSGGQGVAPWVWLDPPSQLRPRVRAEAACVVDEKSGSVLYGRRADEVRPLASMIKLLTALVYLESGGDLNSEIEITPEDAAGAGKSILWKGHKFRARDVLHAALMSSENRAARALARSTPYTEEEFVQRMRDRAAQLGCHTLQVVEPTGLSELNVASAADVARLLIAALANPTIARICQTYRYEFKATNKPKLYRITNSNRMLTSKYRVTGGKTGFIVEAGWCLANRIETPFGPLVTVVMACRSNAARFSETRQLIEWALKYRSRVHTFSQAG
jgi:D-alanyl-D-alanine endopeptidase (penicillin-binding protein 7)